MPTQDYNNLGARYLAIEGRNKAWRRNFSGTTLNTDYWKVVQTGAGQTISVAAGALTVNMNTTINSETIIQSVDGFKLPFRVQFHHAMSQRIANNEVYLEIVNAAGTTYQGWMFDGTTATLAKSVHMNAGASNPASPTGTITVGTTGTTPYIREIDAKLDSVDLLDRPTDSASTASARWTKTRTTLDPDEYYFIRLRFKNLGTAPATNTSNTFETILVQDINDVPVEITAGRGNNSANRNVPVQVNGSVSFAGNSVVGLNATTTGTAASIFRNQAITNVAQTVKGSAGKVYGWVINNPGASAVYFNLYNVVTPTIGTTVPDAQILVPAGQSVNLEATVGLNFPTACTIAAVDTSVPNSAIAPATAISAAVFFI